MAIRYDRKMKCAFYEKLYIRISIYKKTAGKVYWLHACIWTTQKNLAGHWGRQDTETDGLIQQSLYTLELIN